MKKLFLILLVLGMTPALAIAGDAKDDAKLTKKEIKKIKTEREVDSLMVTQDFRFEPYMLTIRNRGNAGTYNESRTNYISVHNGWLDSKLVYGGLGFNFAPTRSEKIDNTWYYDMVADSQIAKITYEFVVKADTGEAVVKIRSNRVGGDYIYNGYIVPN